jgi:hypothetical protein
MEHHHISFSRFPFLKCIDIYLDHDRREAKIVDAEDSLNKITLSADDWNELIRRIKAGEIGTIRQ